MQVPTYLQHQPIIGVDNYDQMDGMYANQTDAMALSIGRAQYDEDHIALKVFRYTGVRWSRQGEELPVHRTLDLTILFLAALLRNSDSSQPVSNLQEEIINPENFQEIMAYYQAHLPIIQPRLQEIRRLLALLP